MHSITFIVSFSLFVQLLVAQPVIGPYKTASKELTNTLLDLSDQKVLIAYPVTTSGEKFPFISYAHGAGGGGSSISVYYELLSQIASYGFVVAAHRSCSVGKKL